MPTEQQAVFTPQDEHFLYRLPAQTGEVIDRSATVTFSFDGKPYRAHSGDTIASALTAAGVKIFSRSFKYHRPRGLLCCSGHCPNCLVRVDDEASVRACRRRVSEGMEVRPQNVWPSLNYDLHSLIRFGGKLLSPGFYYKTFYRPRAFWPFYERIIRRMAGLGVVDPESAPGDFDKQYLHADVAVIGGGPAGMSAALRAADQDARVLLFDENPTLGGHLRYSSFHEKKTGSGAGLEDAVGTHGNISVFTDTVVVGGYEDQWLAAVRGTRLFKIRSRSAVMATGAYETPLLFDNNDLPGVMLGSAVQRLVQLYGTLPGRRAVVVTANDNGWEVAAQLTGAGIAVAAVVEERRRELCTSPFVDEITVAGVPIMFEHTISAAQGATGVTGSVITRTDSLNGKSGHSKLTIDCDLIAVSTGWTPAGDLLYQMGGRGSYDARRGEMLPASLPEGVYAAGCVAGTHHLETQIIEGGLSGRSAAAYSGKGDAPAEEELSALQALKSLEPLRTSVRVMVPGRKKRFLCYCEDVTDDDVELSVAEGYNSMELLKRYSTISMGPCQGKMCSMNTIHLCARANDRTVQETGKTTSRPPFVPVSLGALAGQNMEPVQVTSVHDWHRTRGAKMMVAGVWLRPERYENPADEVRAVREGVGLIDVSTLGKMKLTGPGVPDLLERIYVNQWRKLKVGRVRYGVMCNDEGIILDDGVCAHLKESEWYLTTTSSGSGSIYEWMQWWMHSGWGNNIHLTNMTDVYSAFNVAGPHSRTVLRRLSSMDLSNEQFPYLQAGEAEVAGVPCRILRIGFTGELSFEVHCPAGYGLHVWEALMEAGAEFGIRPVGVEAQRILRLEKAHIIVGQDTDALTNPIAANMEWAVKLKKPDFLGKRSLTPISSDRPGQLLVGFTMVQPGVVPEGGMQIVQRGSDGTRDIIGWVTSCRFSPTLEQTIGLCWLSAEIARERDAIVTIHIDEKLERARVFHGPFYDPQGERLRM